MLVKREESLVRRFRKVGAYKDGLSLKFSKFLRLRLARVSQRKFRRFLEISS